MPKRSTDTTITITLSRPELVRWHRVAKALGVSLEQLAKESIDLVAALRAQLRS